MQVVLTHPDKSVMYTARNWWLAAIAVPFSDDDLDASFDAMEWSELEGEEVDAEEFERWEKEASAAISEVRLLGLFNATVTAQTDGRIELLRAPGAGSEVPLVSGGDDHDEEGRWQGTVDKDDPRALFEVEMTEGDLDTLEQKVGSWDTLVEGYYSE